MAGTWFSCNSSTPGMLHLIPVGSECLALLKHEYAQSRKNSGQHGNNKTGKVLISFEALSRYYFCRGRAISVTHSGGCVSVALISQHAKCMLRVMLLSAARVVLPCFSTLYDKQRNFCKKVIKHKICVLFPLQHVSETSQMYVGLHVKYLLFLSDINPIWIFPTDILNLMGAELLHEDGQTDVHDEANSRFS